MFKTVLFPLDQSQGTRQAAEMVVAMVKQYNSRLILLSVVEPPSEEGASNMSSAEAVEKLLAGAKKLFAEQGIDAEVVEQEGMPSFTICDVADEKKADLIIMGSSGSGMTAEGAAESVTNRVISLSPCPVLVVP
ncbi:MAG: universal stress protein [Spirulina sp. SIO3F2]|nr:universal stress protein [Spirulina sp. SIO3F2]